MLNPRHQSCAALPAYGLPNALRMTIGTEDDNRAVFRRRSPS